MERASLRQALGEIKTWDTRHVPSHRPFGRKVKDLEDRLVQLGLKMRSTWMTLGNLFLNLFLRWFVGFFP